MNKQTKHGTTSKAKRPTNSKATVRAITKAFPGATVIEVAQRRGQYWQVLSGAKVVATLKVVSK